MAQRPSKVPVSSVRENPRYRNVLFKDDIVVFRTELLSASGNRTIADEDNQGREQVEYEVIRNEDGVVVDSGFFSEREDDNNRRFYEVRFDLSDFGEKGFTFSYTAVTDGEEKSKEFNFSVSELVETDVGMRVEDIDGPHVRLEAVTVENRDRKRFYDSDYQLDFSVYSEESGSVLFSESDVTPVDNDVYFTTWDDDTGFSGDAVFEVTAYDGNGDKLGVSRMRFEVT